MTDGIPGHGRSVVAVTGTRADYGLLRPVMRAVDAHEHLRLTVIAAGAHLLPPACTVNEVSRDFVVAGTVVMQRPGCTGRLDDAAAVGRGIEGFATALATIRPDWVLILGDRIEAFAAASAAAIRFSTRHFF